MMGISESRRMQALERKLEELELRLAVVERAESFENSDSIAPRRKPGRPARKVETEAPPAV